jgi:hypothetical protein
VVVLRQRREVYIGASGRGEVQEAAARGAGGAVREDVTGHHGQAAPGSGEASPWGSIATKPASYSSTPRSRSPWPRLDQMWHRTMVGWGAVRVRSAIGWGWRGLPELATGEGTGSYRRRRKHSPCSRTF